MKWLKTLFFISCLSIWTIPAFAITKTPAKNVTTDASAFNKNLSTSDTDVQTALETIDQLGVEGPQGPQGETGPAGPTIYPEAGIAVSTGTSWDTSIATDYFYPASNPLGYLSAESDPIVGAVTGIVKADGAGNISLASAGTDYQSPLTADSDYLTPGTAALTYQPAGAYLTDISGQDLSTADNTTSAFITASALSGYATESWVGLQGYLTEESDPVYSASSWASTTNNSSDWDTAYSWGNHASAGYLTAETDPKVGTLTATKWCTSDGSQVICNTNAPVTSESDPTYTTWYNSGSPTLTSLGIGASATATSSLYAYKSVTNGDFYSVYPKISFVRNAAGTNSARGVRATVESTISENSTNYVIGTYGDVTYWNISSGKTSSGYAIGAYGDAFISSASNQGTLAASYGGAFRAGINNTGAGGTVTNAYALQVRIVNSDADGTITNAYGIYISTAGTTGTYKNAPYGIYQEGTERNHLGGPLTVGNLTVSSATAEAYIKDSSATGSPKVSLYQSTIERAFFQYSNGVGTVIDSDSSLYLQPGNLQSFRFSSAGGLSVGSGVVATDAGAGNILASGNIKLGASTGVTLSAASGVLTMAGVGNTNNENLTFDFESVTNKVSVASTTGVTAMSWTGSFQAGGYKSADGTDGVTVTTCTSFKNGLCVAGT